MPYHFLCFTIPITSECFENYNPFLILKVKLNSHFCNSVILFCVVNSFSSICPTLFNRNPYRNPYRNPTVILQYPYRTHLGSQLGQLALQSVLALEGGHLERLRVLQLLPEWKEGLRYRYGSECSRSQLLPARGYGLR